MIRIKVVRASHLAIGLAVAALVMAAALIFLSWASQRNPSSSQTAAHVAAVSLYENGVACAAVPVFASAVPSKGKSVLIYHTHTHEAYAQTPEDRYEEVAAFRTLDESHSVVRIGEALADNLRDMGYTVIHDTTDHEETDIAYAYERSLTTLQGYAQKFDLYIDLHRDAYSDQTVHTLTADGVPCAQVMFVVGTGADFAEKPDYETNLAFARLATGAMNRFLSGSTRPVMTTDQRYNQHIASPCVLIEVGHHENTLQEAMQALPVLAAALDEALGGD